MEQGLTQKGTVPFSSTYFSLFFNYMRSLKCALGSCLVVETSKTFDAKAERKRRSSLMKTKTYDKNHHVRQENDRIHLGGKRQGNSVRTFDAGNGSYSGISRRRSKFKVR